MAKKKPAKKSAPPSPEPLTPAQRCRRVLAMAGRATAAAATMSDSDQQKYAALIDDQGQPTVPHLIDAVKELEVASREPAPVVSE